MKIYAQIPKIMAEVGAIGKDRKNAQQNYSFRGIDDLYLALHGVLHRNGVFFAPTVLKYSREERESKNGGALIYTVLEVKYTFYADDGSHFEVVTVGEAMDSGDKSANKAMSVALKYALLQVFCIPTEEEKDTESQSHEVKPNPHAVKNMQPGPGDGIQEDDGIYRFTFGQWKQRSIKEVYDNEGPAALASRITYWENMAKKENKPMRPEAVEAIYQIEQFLGAMENGNFGDVK